MQCVDLVIPCVSGLLTLIAMIHVHITTKRYEQQDIIDHVLVPMFNRLMREGRISGFTIKNGKENRMTALELVNSMLKSMKEEFKP